MEKLCDMKERLMCAAYSQMDDLEHVNAAELGEVIDMIKDIEEAIYYCTITEAMHENSYYTEGGGKIAKGAMPYVSAGWGNSYTYTEPDMMATEKMGKSPIHRKTYLEGKENHAAQFAQMRELELYMQELTFDIMEMIKEATPEERKMLQEKISMLASKISA